VGIAGASGAIYGVRLLARLRRNPAVEIHLVLTRAGEKTLFLETGSHASEDAMVVAPCSIQTMSAIAVGITSNVLLRAADVALKERRKLVLMVRETPLHLGHLRTMVALTEMGAIIAPPIPGFYNRPQTVLDLVDHGVDRVLDLMGVPDADVRRWDGPAQ
jgi:4-hydroxy-3-polyprenylbenzoate decarboxylase